MSAAYVFGTAPFRPDDEVYELVSAEAAADHLTLIIREADAGG